MKKLLSVLLLIFLLPLSACGEVKYEFKDGVMYEDGKEATGTFELTVNGFKSKGKFINGLPDGIEVYYSDGSIMRKDTYVNGEHSDFQVYYRNGQLMSTYLKDKRIDIFYDDGQLLMRADREKVKIQSTMKMEIPYYLLQEIIQFYTTKTRKFYLE